MFSPQLYLYEQVKQRQQAMEQVAQQDLEISLAQQNDGNQKPGSRFTLSRLGSTLENLANHLPFLSNEKAGSYTVKFGNS